MYTELKNILILDKNFNKIGVLSNQGANPQAPYYDDLYIQELDTGADIYQFSTPSTSYTRSILVVGNHITFDFNNRQEMFTISSIELTHRGGYNTIDVYAEGIGFELLEIYMKKPEDTEEDKDEEEGGNDSDGDGDDNLDDEYADPDDVVIDENGNIIYIPDKKTSDYANPDNVVIDENGNISYQPNKNKNDYNKDKEEKKYKLSYPNYLKLLVGKTGWSCQCQPGLENNIEEISIAYDTNIYAMLQDSMQLYKGVELEFVYEYNGGNAKKIVKAYNNGGRGSFIGKRFEYGVNVAGITKNEEVINVEDDTVLFVDGFKDIGLEVTYEVDFALRSLEIPDMNIGDTHYVIDPEFNPSQFKARIGKIEISFSDRNKNKIYLANNKKIAGSTPSGLENLDNALGDHDHDRLVYDEKIMNFIASIEPNESWPNLKNTVKRELVFDTGAIMVNALEDIEPDLYPGIHNSFLQFRTVAKKYEDEGTEHIYNIAHSGSSFMPDIDDFYSLGGITLNQITEEYEPKRWKEVNAIDVSGHEGRFLYFLKTNGYFECWEKAYLNYTLSRTNYKTITKGEKSLIKSNDTDLLDFILNEIKIYACENDYDLYTNDYFRGNDWYDAELYCGLPGHKIFAKIDWQEDPDISVRPETRMSTYFKDYAYNPNSLLCALIGAFQQHVTSGGGGGTVVDPSNPDSPIDISKYATIVYVNGKIADLKDYIDDEIANLELNNGGGDNPGGGFPSNIFEVINGKLHIKLPINFEGSANFINCGLTSGRADLSGVDKLDALTIYCANINPREDNNSNTVTIQGNLQVEGTITSTGGTITGNDVGMYLREHEGSTYIVSPHSIVPEDSTQNLGAPDVLGMWDNIYAYRLDVEVIDAIQEMDVEGELVANKIICSNWDQSCDESLKENIRYLDSEVQLMSNDDLLEKSDLYDFIVNQVNICEFNYIDDTRNKIGFIANDYEGTKVGDKIVNTQEFKTKDRRGNVLETNEYLTYDVTNLLFATIGALQEEVRIRDEEINNLKSRLDAIEQILGL